MITRRIRITLIVLTALGVALASYLTYVHYSGEAPICSTKGNTCNQVQHSQYAELAGVSVALIGLIGYVLILGSLLAPEEERTRFATAALTFGGFGFSLYLTYREIFTLHKICEECVSSAILLTIITCLSVWRYLRGADVSSSGNAAAEPAGAVESSATPIGNTY
ncbi:MAG TPA: vitamin K epoxide reductase family protein [Solirubrobacteraceae bacterium]|nr:vitamin K epoxide reductase family protein [Solirubrobacteraceae bacterium]